MARAAFCCLAFGLFVAVSSGGCCSPYHADQGALAGGALGAGTGAIIAGATRTNPLAGAAIGGGLGAITGGLIGNGMDEVEARNRAMIEQQLGRQVAQGAVTIDDAVAMTKAGVSEELIVNHVRTHGMAAPLQANDLILLQQQGVSPRVVSAMQAASQPQPPPMVIQQPAPTPVIVEEYHYGRPYYWHPHPRHYPPPGVSWGVTVAN
jgi:hypothetical protein